MQVSDFTDGFPGRLVPAERGTVAFVPNRQRLQLGRASAALLALVDGLFEPPSVSLAHAAKLLGGVTAASASSNVKKLVDAGILREVTGRKRDQRFVASEILRVAHSD